TEDLDKEATEEIAEFNRFTGRKYNRHSFRKYWTVMSLEEFASEASRPDPQPVVDITVEELVEVVRRAQWNGPVADWLEREYYGDIFAANVPLNNAAMLLSYPLDYDEATNTWGGGRPMNEYDPTPEDIVRQALSGETWRMQ